MPLPREGYAEDAQGGEVREQGEVGDREVAADEITALEVALEGVADSIEVP